ncbi:MAG: hypothetical protein ABSH28_00960 [Acidobacteriota bacterium]|jgi:hypothetical protein
MGNYCRICCRYRANESFSGKGHRIHICKRCGQLPREVRFRIETLDEIWGFLDQSNISPKNIRRLELLAQQDDPEVRKTASVVLEIGKAHPGRRKRYRRIRSGHPELWQKMLEIGIVEEWAPDVLYDSAEEWSEAAEDTLELEASDSATAREARCDENIDDDIPF